MSEMDFADTDDILILDTVEAWQLEVGDQAVIDGDHIEIREILETDDRDEILVKGYSHETGDVDEYPLVWDDSYQLWSV